MSITYKFRNPQTGAVGDVPAERLQEAIADGMEPAQDFEMVNPQTGGKGIVPAAGARQAIADGMLPMGSRGEQAASMSNLEAGARAVASGATMGFDDELIAGIKSLFGPKKYTELRDEYREASKAAEEKLGGVYTGLQIAGGIGGSLLMPGSLAGRGLAAGSKAAIGNAIGQGAVTGLGMGESDLTKGEVMGAARDAAVGGAFGGVAAKALPMAASGLKTLAKGVYETAEDFVSPAVNRALAVGARGGDLKSQVGKLNKAAVQEMVDTGLFRPGELEKAIPDAVTGASFKFAEGSGGRPDRVALMERVVGSKERPGLLPVLGKQIGEIIDDNATTRINTYDKVIGKSADELDKILNAQAVTERGTVETNLFGNEGHAHGHGLEYKGWLQEIADAGNNLKALWKVGQSIGEHGAYNKVPGSKTGTQAVAEVLYRNINEALLDEAEAAGDGVLRTLKRKYAAGLRVRDLLDKGIAEEQARPKIFGVLDKGATMAGATGAGIGYAVGGPVGAQVASGAATALHQFTTSTRGMLWRADMGDKLTKALGKIPRSSAAIRDSILNNPQQFVPLLGPGMYNAIQKMPQKVWENEVRILMPMLEKTDAFAPSEFPTEVDGKVAPADRFSAVQKVEDMDMSPSGAAMRISMINKSGQLPPELRAKGYDEYLAQLQGDGPP